MILRKNSLVSAYSGLQCCFYTHPSAYTTDTSPTALPSPRARSTCTNAKKRRTAPHQYRTYATVKDSKTYDFRDHMNWPCSHKHVPRPDKSTPTPYDIFDIDKTETYTKHKFYDFVKMYHPDAPSRHDPESAVHQIPPLERLERYRLVVQAHTILSDPVLRKAYDTTGAGWGERPSYTRRDGGSRPHTPYEENSPFGNATWEDWERWYARTSPDAPKTGRQSYEGTYMNPNAFASFIILLAVLSGVLQATQAGSYTGSIEERAAAFTAQTGKFLSDRQVENSEYSAGGFSGHGFVGHHGGPTSGNGIKDQRIRHFLERRDPNRYGLKDEEEEAYRLHFSRPGQQDALPPPKPLVRERKSSASATDGKDG